jgi:hypothetical protein
VTAGAMALPLLWLGLMPAPSFESMRTSLLPLLLPSLFACVAAPVNEPEPELELVRLATLDVPSKAPEIVAVDSRAALLAHNDAVSKTVELYTVEWSPPKLAPAASVAFEHEPTSVKIHPRSDLALVAVLGPSPQERGTLRAVSVAKDSFGKVLWTAPVGRHPDSVAVTGDGKYAIVADEGQDDDDAKSSPGTVTVLDVSRAEKAPERTWTLDLSAALAIDAGKIEPELAAADPRSRFAVVTCQENDAAVVVDLRGEAPALSKAVFRLSKGAEPDGVAILDGYSDPELGRGALVAFAEEGREEDGVQLGQALSLHWLGPDPAFDRAVPLARVEMKAHVEKRSDPEGVALIRRGERIAALVSLERDSSVLLFDATEARAPLFRGKQPVGLRPEGLLAFEHGGRTLVVTGDEGDDGKGPGEVSFLEVK